MGLTIVEEGETLYVTGDTYSHRAALRAIGARWDAARKQWCVGREKRDAVEAIVARAATPPAEQAPGLDATVAGRASYKGRTYYVAGRVERGRTRYDDSVRPVVTRDGGKVLLYSRDGSLQFWAPLAQVVGSRIKVGEPIEMTDGAQILTTYSRPMTIASLRET